MAKRYWIAGAALMLLNIGAWANGSADEAETEAYMAGPRGFRGVEASSERETVTMEGTYSLIEGTWPALVTPDGDTYYLMMHFPVAAEDVPAEGAALKVEGFKSPMSPVHLMVLSAEVNGQELSGDWSGFGPGGMMGPGMHRGGRGSGGNRGMGRPDGYGGMSPPPGWGYSDR